MGDLVTFRVDPGLIKRFFSLADFQKAGGLCERGFANARHLKQLPAVGKRAVCGSPLDYSSGDKLAESRDIFQ